MKKKTKACPFCWEEILAVAKKCKHCGEFIENKNEETIEENTKQVSGCKKFLIVVWFVISCILLLWGMVLLTNSATWGSKDLKTCERRLQEKYGDSVYMKNIDIQRAEWIKAIVWEFDKWWKHNFACVKDLTGKKWKNRNWFFMLSVDDQVISQE